MSNKQSGGRVPPFNLVNNHAEMTKHVCLFIAQYEWTSGERKNKLLYFLVVVNKSCGMGGRGQRNVWDVSRWTEIGFSVSLGNWGHLLTGNNVSDVKTIGCYGMTRGSRTMQVFKAHHFFLEGTDMKNREILAIQA